MTTARFEPSGPLRGDYTPPADSAALRARLSDNRAVIARRTGELAAVRRRARRRKTWR